MTLGAGKYDAECTQVRESAGAAGAIVIVIGGKHGHGFSAQADYPTMAKLPELLETLARQIREDTTNEGDLRG